MSCIFVVSRGILAMTSPASMQVAVLDDDVRADREEVARVERRCSGACSVSPVFGSLSEMRGRRSAARDSMTTLRERPVTSSSFSIIVTPSTRSPNFTMPRDLGEDRHREGVPLGEELARP